MASTITMRYVEVNATAWRRGQTSEMRKLLLFSGNKLREHLIELILGI